MGGRYPKHDDPRKYGNFKPDADAAVVVVRDWPTPVVFSGLGGEETLLTGQTLNTTPRDNPVRKAYELFLGGKPARQSADLVTVLYGGSTRMLLTGNCIRVAIITSSRMAPMNGVIRLITRHRVAVVTKWCYQ